MSQLLFRTPIERIKIGKRFRNNTDEDIRELASSMHEIGLLHPIVVTSDYVLVAGLRRLVAAKKLGWAEIDARVVKSCDEAINALQAERDENTCRVPFAPSEMHALARAIEEIERPKAANRKAATQAKPGNDLAAKDKTKTDGNGGAESAPPKKQGENGKSREKVAEAVGVGRTKLKQIKEVVEAAEADPANADLVEEMDATGKVDPVHRKLKERQQTHTMDAAGLVVPQERLEVWRTAERMRRAVLDLQQVANAANEIATSPGGEWLRTDCTAKKTGDKFRHVMPDLQKAMSSLKSNAPHATWCVYCESLTPGKIDPKCNGCKGLGYVTECVWDAAPSDYREDVIARHGADNQ